MFIKAFQSALRGPEITGPKTALRTTTGYYNANLLATQEAYPLSQSWLARYKQVLQSPLYEIQPY
jgi:hypothetical protein